MLKVTLGVEDATEEKSSVRFDQGHTAVGDSKSITSFKVVYRIEGEFLPASPSG